MLKRALAAGLLLAGPAHAADIVSSYGLPGYPSGFARVPPVVIFCPSTDGSNTAVACNFGGGGTATTSGGSSGGSGGSTPTTAAGTASGQLVGVQGGGPNALPVGVSATALPLPAGAATAANQAALNADGGSQVHVTNLPATQPVSGTVNLGTVLQAARSGAWADASFTAGGTASVPAGLAAVAARTGFHVWNVGTSTACLNYTAAAAASGSGCAAGSVPIPAGSAYLEDQPGNVSPEAISLVCAGSACPLTIKVR